MPAWSAEDERLARAAQKMMGAEVSGLRTKIGALSDAGQGGRAGAGSDDIAEVSWNVPTVVLRYPGNIPGMVGHHWSSGIAMATPIAHKGATVGAKAYALTVLDLLRRPEILDQAARYFAGQTASTKWKSLIPEGTKPPIHFNADKMERFRPELKKLRYDPSRYKTYLEQLGINYPTVE
jgi:aminobenzoyl-glutamate utilization protein B